MSALSTPSPYQAVLGERFGALHPQLRGYFGPIPRGSAGVGEGVFETVGTPRPWIRWLIRAFVPADVLFPVWERDVRFRIRNAPVRGMGTALGSEREFFLRDGTRTMRDSIAATPDGLEDTLGSAGRLIARFTAVVEGDGLRLRSHRIWVRAGDRRIAIPRCFAPCIVLTEVAGADGGQRVDVVVLFPLVGRVYEYRGTFRYRIIPGEEES